MKASAREIAGRGTANPACCWTGATTVERLAKDWDVRRVLGTVQSLVGAGDVAPDTGGPLSATAIEEA